MGLIDKERLVTELKMAYAEPICSIEEAIDIALTTINEQPTVDVDSLNATHEDIGYEKGYRDGYAEALDVTVDAEPIRHGHWEWNDYGGFGNYHCTVCRYIPYGKFSRKFCPDYMYCPRCGAKMDPERLQWAKWE